MHENGLANGTEASSRNGRFYWFLSSAILSSLLFGLFIFTCMMVPGMLPNEKRWMFGTDAILLACPLIVGLWRFAATDAPVNKLPLGPVIELVVALEIIVCIVVLIDPGR
jgi:hypothetical protein